MAAPNAVRRGGSLLLRTLAVSGLAAAAWLVCGGVAAAGEDHPDEAAKTLDAVNVAIDEQQTAAADLVTSVVPAGVAPFAAVGVAAQPFGSPSSGSSSLASPSLGGVELAAVESRPLAVMTDGPAPEPEADQEPYPESSSTGGYSYSSGYASGYSHSGTASNTMPAPLYEAKIAQKAAARAAVVEAPVSPTPQPVALAAPVRVNVLLAPTAEPSPDVSPVTPNAEVIWEVPEPSAPAPTPKQAPAPSAPTASSGGADSGGGGHRGGVNASLTGQADLKPLVAWSAERWDDGRSPGSVPGLPSTSPD